jgi:hypothetical protein
MAQPERDMGARLHDLADGVHAVQVGAAQCGHVGAGLCGIQGALGRAAPMHRAGNPRGLCALRG